MSDHAVLLLTVVEVDKDDRVNCQALGCGRPVHKRIHVAMIGKDFKVLGSDCYQMRIRMSPASVSHFKVAGHSQL